MRGGGSSRRDAKRPVQHRPEDREKPDSGPAVSEPQVRESRENLPVPVTSGPDGSDATVGTETPTDSGESSTDETDAEHTDASTEEILDDYREFATGVLNRSENTVDVHARYVGRLLKHADKPPEKVTQSDIIVYLDTEGDLSAATRMNIIGSLRVFFRDFLDRNVMDAFEMPSKSAKPTDVPSKAELQTFYEALENPKYKAIFLFAASSGLRSGELLSLTMDDIDEDKRMLIPDRESSTKQSWVTFYNEEAAEALEVFKPERKPDDERVFQTGKRSPNRASGRCPRRRV